MMSVFSGDSSHSMDRVPQHMPLRAPPADINSTLTKLRTCLLGTNCWACYRGLSDIRPKHQHHLPSIFFFEKMAALWPCKINSEKNAETTSYVDVNVVANLDFNATADVDANVLDKVNVNNIVELTLGCGVTWLSRSPLRSSSRRWRASDAHFADGLGL